MSALSSTQSSSQSSAVSYNDPLKAARHLTLRDRLLLSWLAEHYVLSTSQITAALFPSRPHRPASPGCAAPHRRSVAVSLRPHRRRSDAVQHRRAAALRPRRARGRPGRPAVLPRPARRAALRHRVPRPRRHQRQTATHPPRAPHPHRKKPQTAPPDGCQPVLHRPLRPRPQPSRLAADALVVRASTPPPRSAHATTSNPTATVSGRSATPPSGCSSSKTTTR